MINFFDQLIVIVIVVYATQYYTKDYASSRKYILHRIKRLLKHFLLFHFHLLLPRRPPATATTIMVFARRRSVSLWLNASHKDLPSHLTPTCGPSREPLSSGLSSILWPRSSASVDCTWCSPRTSPAFCSRCPCQPQLYNERR